MTPSTYRPQLEGIAVPWTMVLLCLLGVVGVTYLPHAEFLSSLSSHYLPIHMVLESSSIFVSFGIFLLGWATFHKVRNSSLLALSVTGLSVGLLDLGHTLSYTGMPDFITPSGPNKAIYFWIAGRATDVLALFFIAVFYDHHFRFRRFAPLAMVGGLLWTSFCFYAILFEPYSLPTFFTPGIGLSEEKVMFEWAAMGVAALTALICIVRAWRRRDHSLHWFAGACLISVMVGYFFTQYREFDDLFNFCGHIYKSISFAFIFHIVFHECVSRPYEEMKHLAKEASEANASKVRFLANVSHEIRTPLGVISGFGSLLKSSKSLVGEEKEWIATILRNCGQLRILIDDLLDLAKVDTGRITTHLMRFKISEIVEDVVSGLQLLAQQKNLTLTTYYDPSAPNSIHSDPHRLRQILMNLIGNALKFTEKGGVSVRVLGGGPGDLLIFIDDTGIGIDSRAVTRLFKPFSQVDDTLTRKFGGTGLGLALSKRLAGVLGGDLWLERTALNVGSTFGLKVVNQKAEAETVVSGILRPEEKLTGAPDLQKLNILAAEDSSDNQALLTLYLKPTGAHLNTVVNGREAWKASRKKSFNVILMDIQMPEMDGYEATARIRRDGWSGPIIALTAHAQQWERERALSEGFDDYLVKPFTKEQLWQSLLKNIEN